MRFIHALVSATARESVESTLDDEQIDYVLTQEADDGDESRYVVHFPLPAQAVDSVLETLYDAGLDESFVVIGNADAASTPHFQELEERYVDGSEEDDAIVRDEIASKARTLNPSPRTYYAMTLLSVLVATVGLLAGSPAIVVGSMVIAPQIGAALTASVGLAFSDRRLIVDGVRSQVLGLAVAVGFAILFGVAIRHAAFVPTTMNVATISQVSTRTSPGVLSLVVGVCAGAAGAFGLSTDLPVSLVGVAVAAALIPAAAAIGIGVAWGYPVVALGAFVLLVLNLVSITVSGAVALWYLGYRPADWTPSSPGNTLSAVRDGVLTDSLVALAVFAVVIAIVGTAVVGQSAFQQATTRAVEDELAQSNATGLELVSVRTAFGDQGIVTETRDVTIRLRSPPGTTPDGLATRFERRIEGVTGSDVTVSVIYVTRTTSARDTAGATSYHRRGPGVSPP